jgi:lipopolysaccharide transport system ATP-binding protein
MITAENLCIRFPVESGKGKSFKGMIAAAAVGGRISSSGGDQKVDALKDLSFQIGSGDRVGLVGHNGSGKTTLLRVLSGIYQPTSGAITVGGRVNSMLDIGVGLDSDSTGYENIYIRAILLGLTKREIDVRIEEIADFSELGDYLDLPLRTYSSGMLLRLAFSVAATIESDVLLMDEWLSVGDAEFNKKATNKLNELIDKNSLMVLASHSPELIKNTCNRVFLMRHGALEEMSVNEYWEYASGL